MASAGRRKGIEKKILTSVLWVGVVPMLVVFAVGFVVIKGSIWRSAHEELEKKALNLVDAIDSGLRARTVLAEALAISPDVRAVLSPGTDSESHATATGPRADLASYFEWLSHLHGEEIVEVSLLDRNGMTLVSSNLDTEDDLSGAEWWEDMPTDREWSIAEVMLHPGRHAYHARVIAPLRSETTQDPLGYINLVVDIDTVLEMMRRQDTDHGDQVLFAVVGEQGGGAFGIREPGEPFESYELDGELAKTMLAAGAGCVYSRWGDAAYFVGYAPMRLPIRTSWTHGTDLQVFVAVRRPATAVFAGLNRVSLATLLGGISVLALLCFREARRIHNNIVRPVSLLNEGAQIIGQGDLELKLKINTRDEIEELAASFNRMALDLKANIHQLEESEHKYRGLVTSIKEGIYQTDLAGVITYANPSAAEIFGCTDTDQFIGRPFDMYFTDEADVAWFRSAVQSTGYVAGYRCWMRREDGENICVELSASQLRDQDGLGIGSDGIVRDVTQRVELEREAREKAERIAVINEITNAINSSLDVDRVLETVAVEIHKLVEFDEANLMLLTDGRRELEYYRLWPNYERAPDLRIEPDHPVEWVLNHREPLVVSDPTPSRLDGGNGTIASQVVLPLVLQDNVVGTFELGSKRPSAFTQYHLEILEQVAAQLAVAVQNAKLYADLENSFEDVKRAREELARANAELMSLDIMKTNLLSNVSHELRTPLVSIMGYTDMIFNEKAGPVNETQREYLSISLRNIDRLVTLIENLLDFSRLHRGTEALVFETFNVVDVARTSVEMLRPTAASRDIEIEIETAEPQFEIDGDRGKLGQVFSNLLSNAVKFNVDGGHVWLKLARSGSDIVEVSVRDTGIGIAENELDKVFTRFYQCDASSTRKYGGTGIGLSIAQDIVRLHGGRVTVTSTLGEGSTFRFTLPLSRTDEADAAADISSLPQPHIIEVVTADNDLRATVKSFCDREDISLINASSPEDATALAKRHRPDCILVDTDTIADAMSNVVLALKKGVTKKTPVVLVSNDTKPLYDEQAEFVAARLHRSFSRNTFLHSVKYAMDPRRKRGAPSSRHVLVVDDDPEVIDFVTRSLTAEGYAVDGLTTGNEVLDLLRSGSYGLLLLDIAMPGVDGWQVCSQVKNDPALSGIHICMVTARPEAEVESEFARYGADGYLLKPFRSDELLSRVMQVLPRPAKTQTGSRK